MDEFNGNRYAGALCAKQGELLTGLQKREGLTVEPEADMFDEVQLGLDRAMVIQALDRTSLLLRDVQAALERIRNGSFGQCVQCEEEISPKRLAAIPWAKFCLKCQEQADTEERQRLSDSDFLNAA
jgi:DnaK suppressor protein